jgi:hypothetical protein
MSSREAIDTLRVSGRPAPLVADDLGSMPASAGGGVGAIKTINTGGRMH